MFDFLKKLFKGDESKKTDSKPVKKTTKPKTEPKKTAVTKSKTVKKESVKKTKPKNEEKQLRPDKKIETDLVIEKKGSPNKEEKLSFAEKIKQGLKKTRDAISENLSALSFTKKIDQEFYDELEMTLIAADVGYAATQQIITELKDRVKKEKLEDGSELKSLLKKILS